MPVVRYHSPFDDTQEQPSIEFMLDLLLEMQRTVAEIAHHVVMEAHQQPETGDQPNIVLYLATQHLHRVAVTLHVPAFKDVPEDPSGT